MADRIENFDAFWEYYLGEHRNPLCRALHFFGTSGMALVSSYCLYDRPLLYGSAMALAILLGIICYKMESRRPAAPVLCAFIGLAGLAHPLAMAGVLFAYFYAWLAHFLIEKNRPATFTYPYWSLLGDLRMWLWMLGGKLWTGDVCPTPLEISVRA
jgi:hypothetical protein